MSNYTKSGPTLQERTTDDSKESESLKQLLTARMQEFIEEMLIPHFGGMMTFVKDCEAAFDRGNIDILKSYESTLLGHSIIAIALRGVAS